MRARAADHRHVHLPRDRSRHRPGRSPSAASRTSTVGFVPANRRGRRQPEYVVWQAVERRTTSRASSAPATARSASASALEQPRAGRSATTACRRCSAACAGQPAGQPRAEPRLQRLQVVAHADGVRCSRRLARARLPSVAIAPIRPARSRISSAASVDCMHEWPSSFRETISLAHLNHTRHCGGCRTPPAAPILILTVTIAATTAATAVVRAAALARIGGPATPGSSTSSRSATCPTAALRIFFETWPNFLRLATRCRTRSSPSPASSSRSIGCDDRGRASAAGCPRHRQSLRHRGVPPMLGQAFNAADGGVMRRRSSSSVTAVDGGAGGDRARSARDPLSDVPGTVVGVMRQRLPCRSTSISGSRSGRRRRCRARRIFVMRVHRD